MHRPRMTTRRFPLLPLSIGAAALLATLPASTQERTAPSPGQGRLTVATVHQAGAVRSIPEPMKTASAGTARHGTARHGKAAAGGELAPGAAGMIVGVDPETGRLGMPTPEQRLRLAEKEQAALSHSSVGLVEVHRPDGPVLIDLH